MKRFLAALLLAAGPWAAAGAAVVINEVVYNPEGSDAGFEWIELYNDGASAVSLAGWALQPDLNAPWADVTSSTLTLSGAIPAGGFFLIESSETATALPAGLVLPGLSLSNGSSKADGFRLLDASGGEVDRLVYGEPDEDRIGAEGGFGNEARAAAEGASLARIAGGRDRDNNKADFFEDATPTPAAENDPMGQVAAQCLSVPNPFLPAIQPLVTFTTPESLLTQPFHEVRIYTVAGELIRTLPQAFQWDGRNEHGDLVTTGLYHFVLETEGGKRRGKVTVIR